MPYSEIWSTTKGDETKLLIFGRKIFIKVQVLGAIFNTKICQYEIMTDSNIQRNFEGPNIQKTHIS